MSKYIIYIIGKDGFKKACKVGVKFIEKPCIGEKVYFKKRNLILEVVNVVHSIDLDCIEVWCKVKASVCNDIEKVFD